MSNRPNNKRRARNLRRAQRLSSKSPPKPADNDDVVGAFRERQLVRQEATDYYIVADYQEVSEKMGQENFLDWMKVLRQMNNLTFLLATIVRGDNESEHTRHNLVRMTGSILLMSTLYESIKTLKAAQRHFFDHEDYKADYKPLLDLLSHKVTKVTFSGYLARVRNDIGFHALPVFVQDLSGFEGGSVTFLHHTGISRFDAHYTFVDSLAIWHTLLSRSKPDKPTQPPTANDFEALYDPEVEKDPRDDLPLDNDLRAFHSFTKPIFPYYEAEGPETKLENLVRRSFNVTSALSFALIREVQHFSRAIFTNIKAKSLAVPKKP
ncbi:hypothetical protein [Gemmatimonas aurantiaca]|uniref:hypothetical protein n=1 Tax=Gemmatimonas aurantiaca TaxID=173480 RepID=UPI00301CC6B6